MQTVNQLITKYGNDPNYKVKSKKSPLFGYSIEDLKKVRDGIFAKRGVPKTVFEKQLQAGKYRLKSTPPQEKRETAQTPLEKAVMSRIPAFELSDDEDDFSNQDWEIEGSGFYDDEAEKLIDQPHLSLGSIKAGNSSIKLKNQVLFLLDSLVDLGAINKKEKKKNFLYITMVFDILLDSSLAKLERGGERNVSHDFTVSFYPPIELGEGNYKAALNRLITMSYSWNNIDSRYDNNKIRWKKKTEQAWKTLTFPNGMYDHKRINTFIQQHTGKVDPTNKDSNYIFTMYFDMSIYRVVTLIHKDYELDLSQGNFGKLIGYGKSTLRGDVVGRKVPNITRGVDWVYLHCDLISRQTNNVPSDVLYSFSTSDLHVSYPFRKEPRRLEWQPVNKSNINAIRFWVTDGRNNILDLNGTDIAISLMIEKD